MQFFQTFFVKKDNNNNKNLTNNNLISCFINKGCNNNIQFLQAFFLRQILHSIK